MAEEIDTMAGKKKKTAQMKDNNQSGPYQIAE